MKKLIIFLAILLCCSKDQFAQDCGERILDPGIASFLNIIGYRDLSLQQLRQIPIELLKYPEIPLVPFPEQDVQRIKITADSIPVLVFNPHHKSNLPVIIHYHGGGFISPLVKGLEHSLWQEANAFDAIIFAVDYRVAPEHKFPAAVNDSYNSFLWISRHAGEYGGDTSRIILMGNSAGANLAAVVAQKARKENLGNKIKLHVLNGLPADLTPGNMESSLSYQQNATGYFQTKALCYFAVENYAPGQADNPEVSPIQNPDLSGLPPALIITAEFDPLRDDGMRYASRLRESGVRVVEKCFPGQIHCLIGSMPGDSTTLEFHKLVKQAMAESFKIN